MELVVFLIGIGIGGGVAWVLAQRRIQAFRREVARVEREKEEEEQIAFGFEDFNRQIQQLKEARKAHIIEEIGERGPLPSSYFGDLFELSDRTVQRYLAELEEEQKLVRTHATGRNTRWQLI